MATSKTKKQEILDCLEKDVLSQKSVLFLSVSGAEKTLDSEGNLSLRKKARQEGVKLQMVKLNLVKNLFKESASNFDSLKGQIYLAYKVNKEESDEVSVAKTMVKVVKEDFKETLNVFGSVVNNEFYNSEKTLVLSDTPTFDDSMSMVAGTVSTIISKNATLISQVSSGLARGVQAISEKKS